MYEQVIVAACAVVFGHLAVAPDESPRPHPAATHQVSAPGNVPVELNNQLGRHLDALLDELLLLSLQPGNDEDENKAVSDAIDVVHEAGIQLYDDLNKCDDSQAALAPLVARYLALRERVAVLVTAHGPIRRNLPAPFAEMRSELERMIGVFRRELHSDDEVEKSRLDAVHELYSSAAVLKDDVIWSGLRKRTEDIAVLRTRFATIRRRNQELFP